MLRLTELLEVSCRPSLKILALLERLDNSQHKFQLVLGDRGELLGTITDGDIRRAMLRGVRLQDPVSECMRADPAVGRLGADDENTQKLHAVKGYEPFLPVTDDTGAVRELWILSETESPIGAALVMAGGFGKRLGHYTESTPKPLLPVGGRPIVERIIDSLEDIGVVEIYVSVHYLPEQFEAYLEQRDNRARINLIVESEPLGTAGAVGTLPAPHDGSLLVLNGDVLTRTDFVALDAFHRRHGHQATLGVTPYEVDIPFGVVRQTADGIFAGIDEKPRLTHFVAAGIYYLSNEIRALVPPAAHMDMPELLNRASSIGLQVGLFPIHEYWVDVGRPDDLVAARHDHEGRS
jgi:dTDP-glucose pyrophosphorylase